MGAITDNAETCGCPYHVERREKKAAAEYEAKLRLKQNV